MAMYTIKIYILGTLRNSFAWPVIFDSHEQVRCEDFMAVALKITAVWDVTCRLVDTYYHSVGTAPPVSILKTDATLSFKTIFIMLCGVISHNLHENILFYFGQIRH